MATIQIKRGTSQSLVPSLAPGEMAYVGESKELWIGDLSGGKHRICSGKKRLSGAVRYTRKNSDAFYFYIPLEYGYRSNWSDVYPSYSFSTTPMVIRMVGSEIGGFTFSFLPSSPMICPICIVVATLTNHGITEEVSLVYDITYNY